MEENQNIENVNQPNQNPAASAATGKAKAPKKEEKQKKSSGAGTVIMVVIIVALLGGVGFLLFRDQEKSKVILAKQQSIDTLSLEVESQLAQLTKLQADLTSMESRASELEMENSSLKAMIEDIEKLKEDLKKAKGNAWYFQREMNKYKSQMTSFNAKIDSLQEVNRLALLKIDTLNVEKKYLGDTISQIKQEKSILTEKVAIASIMRSEELSLTAINAKGKEYPGPEFKNKQLSKLKFVFYLAENKVAPQNEKNIVMRLIEPDGTVLFSGTDGGSFDTAEGDEKMYTMSQMVTYSGTKQKVAFVYQKGNPFKSGKHSLEVFADGHLIGKTSFNVK